MRVTWSVFALGLLGVSGWSPSAEAAHTRHHPWGAKPHAASTTSVQTVKKPVYSSAPTETKTSVNLEDSKPIPSAEKKNAGDKIADQALTYKGTRYKYGGTTTKGMDCSGLVSRIYADLKMHRVPRVSAALYKSGRPVSTTELRPGDLVFFKNTYKRGISHVGVYAGNNKFVHAANKKHGVIVTSLADPYYQIHFAGARRLY